MLLEHVSEYLSLAVILKFCVLGLVATLLYNKYGTGLNHVPGPALAGYTDFWRLWVVWKRRPELVHIRLHDQYGSVVRLGPRTVLVSDNKAAKAIYALNAGFIKSDFYPVQQTVAKGRPLQSLFNTTDEVFHAKLRRAVSNAYAMSTIVQYEPLVDSTTTAFLTQLKQRYADREDSSGVCDFGTWLQFYAFDVIGELTYSKRLGFVDRGEDVDSIISNLEWLLNYVSVIGQMPILDRFFLKNPFRLWKSAMGFSNSNTTVVEFAKKRMADRQTGSTDASTADGRPQRDFLSRFSDAHKKDPSFISQERVLALTVANMFAGSDTTAITLRAIFYHLIRQPATLTKLLAELAAAEARGALDGGGGALVAWAAVRDLPYLGAVVMEALRVHPAAGLPLERVVPAPQGLEVCGARLPPGTVVGCSAWVLHRDERVFGGDVDAFRPERWIEAGEERRAEMKNCLFAFGAGARTCIGKNISLLEIYKLVPAVLRSFEISLVNPEEEWTIHNAWFVKQSNFHVRLRSKTKT
ncbi:cytochrome p450 [Neofusicoccum parvum]|nr:cytochrome p450 [Neofusicoccum parvum]